MGVTHIDQQLIDVHAHFLTDSYVLAARAGGQVHPDGMVGWPSWSADEHLRLMDRWGVATAMLSISSPGTHFGDDAAARRLTREVNEAGAAISRANPGRFGHFASLPLPDVPGALDELGYTLDELDCDGIAIETNSAGVYLGDNRYEPLYRELNRRRVVVFVHPTSPPCAEATALGRPRPMLEFIFDTTPAVTAIAGAGLMVKS
jgi:6-methylsalicylate decarboxylase